MKKIYNRNNLEKQNNLNLLDDLFICIDYENTLEFKSLYLKGKAYEIEKYISINLIIPSHKKIAEEYLCNICKNIPFVPIMCSNTEKIFCICCIEKRGKCPFKCRKCQIITLKEKYLNIFNLIKIKCIFSKLGCKYISEKEKYDEHIKNCPYGFKYKCKFCDFEGNINFCREHTKVCGGKKIFCKYCGNENIKKYLYKKHIDKCKKEEVYCPHCLNKFTRENLIVNHTEFECIKTQLNYANQLIENQKKIIDDQKSTINQMKNKLNHNHNKK
jgi:hypothetical protein